MATKEQLIKQLLDLQEGVQHYSPTLSEISENITFENAHEVAYCLSHSTRPEVAKALYEELKYWVDR